MANEPARALRKRMTDAERKLWLRLKTLDINGSHFRKQAPMGGYVLDFVCHAAKLVVEVDGGQHAEDRQLQRDARRTEWLQSQGYGVLRFWNTDVIANTDGVIAVIADEVGQRLRHKP